MQHSVLYSSSHRPFCQPKKHPNLLREICLKPAKGKKAYKRRALKWKEISFQLSYAYNEIKKKARIARYDSEKIKLTETMQEEENFKFHPRFSDLKIDFKARFYLEHGKRENGVWWNKLLRCV